MTKEEFAQAIDEMSASELKELIDLLTKRLFDKEVKEHTDERVPVFGEHYDTMEKP